MTKIVITTILKQKASLSQDDTDIWDTQENGINNYNKYMLWIFVRITSVRWF